MKNQLFTLAELKKLVSEERTELLLRLRDEVIRTIMEYEKNDDQDLVNMLNILLVNMNKAYEEQE